MEQVAHRLPQHISTAESFRVSQCRWRLSISCCVQGPSGVLRQRKHIQGAAPALLYTKPTIE